MVHLVVQNSFRQYLSIRMSDDNVISVNSELISEVATFCPITLFFLSISYENVTKHQWSYELPNVSNFEVSKMFLTEYDPFYNSLRINVLSW